MWVSVKTQVIKISKSYHLFVSLFSQLFTCFTQHRSVSNSWFVFDHLQKIIPTRFFFSISCKLFSPQSWGIHLGEWHTAYIINNVNLRQFCVESELWKVVQNNWYWKIIGFKYIISIIWEGSRETREKVS